MGKIRVKTLGDEEQEKLQKEEAKRKAEAKKAEKQAEVIVEEAQPVEETVPQEEVTESETKEEVKEVKKVQKKTDNDKQTRSSKYQTIAQKVDKSKEYSLNEALELLEGLKRGSFDETVELHLNTLNSGISGSVVLPNGTGKKTRVVIADDKTIAEIEKGVINFDILVAHPSMMPKLAKVAKVLGPRGLMPNPKNGTVNPNPEEVVKKYEGGQVNFKTEAKSPILHLTVGKMSFGASKLEENIKVMLNAVKKSNIKNATLKSTMSPGIKVRV